MTYFPPPGFSCPVSVRGNLPCLSVSCIFSCLVVVSWRPASFSKNKRKGGDLVKRGEEGGELGDVEVRKTEVRMHCIRQSIFIKKNKKYIFTVIAFLPHYLYLLKIHSHTPIFFQICYLFLHMYKSILYILFVFSYSSLTIFFEA